MSYKIKLAAPTKPEWVEAVLNDFDTFLRDHADGERKASFIAMSFVAKFPDRVEIIPDLIETGIEELEHFQAVYKLMEKRGLKLRHSIGEDLYMKALIQQCHSGREERFMDRLLVIAVVETRGVERFRLVAEALEDPELKDFYTRLWMEEEKHGTIFVDMALKYFPEEQVYERLTWWVEREGEVMTNMEIRPALH